MLAVFQTSGSGYGASYSIKDINNEFANIDCNYIWVKDRLSRSKHFPSESDMEAYIIMSLKNTDSKEFECFIDLFKKYSTNDLIDSTMYNQFIFGNAYPSDIVIINENNINILELKKDPLTQSQLPQIEKEMKKHLCYSLFSNRIRQTNTRRFNFYLVTLRDRNNNPFISIIKDKYLNLCNKIKTNRENTLTFVEYNVNDYGLSFEEVPL